MPYLDQITPENFNRSFNLKNILTRSVFYPSSGLDGTAIKMLTNQYFSFVHVDYETSEVDVRKAMKCDFVSRGYDLIGIQNIPINKIAPLGLDPAIFLHDATEYEQRKLETFEGDLFRYKNFRPFAIWAVYEFNPARNVIPNNYSPRFSLLHIGAEACITLQNVYAANRINPEIVVIINPGEAFGENWTLYTDPTYRFYQTLLNIANNNPTQMLGKVITNWPCRDRQLFWPGYHYAENVRVPSNNYQFPHDKFEIYERS